MWKDYKKDALGLWRIDSQNTHLVGVLPIRSTMCYIEVRYLGIFGAFRPLGRFPF